MFFTTTSTVAVWLLSVSGAALAPPQPVQDSIVSREGYATVAWDGDAELYEVDLRTEGDKQWSSHLVAGTSLFVSGLVDNAYTIRIRAVDESGAATSGWSRPLALDVRHHGRGLTLTLFAIGLLVVTVTVGFILTALPGTRAADLTGTNGN